MLQLTLQEAARAARRASSTAAKILAGGQSLIPAMRFRLAVPETLIDINNLTELQYIREEDGYLAIGALTREAIARSLGRSCSGAIPCWRTRRA